MQSRTCSECKKPAEPPLDIYRSHLPDQVMQVAEEEGIPLESEYVFCIDCQARRSEEAEALKELEALIRNGSNCPMCHDELDPPGGYTVSTFDGTQLMRMCLRCKGTVERDRRERGKS